MTNATKRETISLDDLMNKLNNELHKDKRFTEFIFGKVCKVEKRESENDPNWTLGSPDYSGLHRSSNFKGDEELFEAASKSAGEIIQNALNSYNVKEFE